VSKNPELLSIIKGSIVSKRYFDENTEFGIFSVKLEGGNNKVPPSFIRNGLITVKGTVPLWAFDIKYEFSGYWSTHSKFGPQFTIERYEELKPETREDIIIWLSSGLIKNVGKKMAERIVDYFGLETNYILEEHPEKLQEVDGIGKKRAKEITDAVSDLKKIREIITFLKKHEVGLATAIKIHKKYRDKSIEVIKQNPYQLAEDIDRIGFKICDAIALSLGFKTDSKFRLKAMVIYLLKEAQNEGHCYLTVNQIIDKSQKLIGEIPSNFSSILEELEEDKLFIEEINEENINIYLKSNYYLEKKIAGKLLAINETSRDNEWIDYIDEVKSEILNEDGIELTDEQINCLETILKEKLLILTGPGGTGKTQVTKAIIKLLEKNDISYCLAGPTGRSANRLEELTGRKAKTIHRLLEFHPELGFQRCRFNQLDNEVIIVDEASMVDIRLLNRLLDACRNNMTLIFIGDYHQLPSIKAGNFLYDILYSKVLPSIELTKIHRQAAESHIIQAAHSVLQGFMPDFPQTNIYNFQYHPAIQYYFIESENQAIVNNLIKIINNIKDTLGYDDLSKYIQVITPMNKGDLGTNKLNEILQDYYNRYNNKQIKSGRKTFKLGDRIIQTINNYDKMVYNGDFGKIIDVDMSGDILKIKFDLYNEIKEYNKCDLHELNLGYAITIHKAQGSEIPIIIQIISNSHYVMLQRNLLYTGITRSKKASILLGQKRAMYIGIQNNKIIHRNTMLYKRLQEKDCIYDESLIDNDDERI